MRQIYNPLGMSGDEPLTVEGLVVILDEMYDEWSHRPTGTFAALATHLNATPASPIGLRLDRPASAPLNIKIAYVGGRTEKQVADIRHAIVDNIRNGTPLPNWVCDAMADVRVTAI